MKIQIKQNTKSDLFRDNIHNRSFKVWFVNLFLERNSTEFKITLINSQTTNICVPIDIELSDDFKESLYETIINRFNFESMTDYFETAQVFLRNQAFDTTLPTKEAKPHQNKI